MLSLKGYETEWKGYDSDAGKLNGKYALRMMIVCDVMPRLIKTEGRDASSVRREKGCLADGKVHWKTLEQQEEIETVAEI